MKRKPAPRLRRAPARQPSPQPDAPSDEAASLAQLFTAADAALARAAHAARADVPEADSALRSAERLARATASLAQARARAGVAPEPPARDPAADEAARASILGKIDRALAAGREARRLQVEALRARGLDPRLGWRWDDAAQEWVWDPGTAMAGEAKPLQS